jgi:hypothetical protein
MYIEPNLQTKKALKEAVAKGEKIRVFSPGLFPAPVNGSAVIEGPHGVHKWYASVIVKDGYVEKVTG